MVSHEIDKPLSHCCFTHQSPISCKNGSLTTIFLVVLNDDDDVSLTYTCTLYPLFYTNFKNKRLVVNQFNAALVCVDSEIYYIAWFSRKGEKLIHWKHYFEREKIRQEISRVKNEVQMKSELLGPCATPSNITQTFFASLARLFDYLPNRKIP